jgi:hypothetical protein
MMRFVSAAPAAQQVAFGRRCMVYASGLPARRDGNYYGLNLGLLDLRARETSLGSNCNIMTHGLN